MEMEREHILGEDQYMQWHQMWNCMKCVYQQAKRYHAELRQSDH